MAGIRDPTPVKKISLDLDLDLDLKSFGLRPPLSLIMATGDSTCSEQIAFKFSACIFEASNNLHMLKMEMIYKHKVLLSSLLVSWQL